ncbi:hypothetical protein B0H14DRAFT_1586101 [Mycena olivaceomarginata]|nr:hypothetical protein B0H14DRAFT_1586101 [Mycena olivaceomarginata]
MHDISDVEPVTDAEVNETLSLFDADQPGIATLPPNATLPYFSVNYRPISAGAKSACSLVVGRAISCGRLWDVFEGVLVQDTAASDASVLRVELDRGVYNSTEQPAALTSVLKRDIPNHTRRREMCASASASSPQTPARPGHPNDHELRIHVRRNCTGGAKRGGPLLRAAARHTGDGRACYGFWEGTIQVHTNFQEQRRGGVDVWMFVLENLGADVSASAVAAKWGHHHDLYFEPIIDLYRALHAARVVHNDLELRHIRHLISGPPKCLQLIDFEGGKANAGEGETKAEMRKLFRCLGLNPRRFDP